MEKFRWSDQESLEDLLAQVVMQYVENIEVHTECFEVEGPDGVLWRCVAYDDQNPIQPGFKERFIQGLYKEFQVGV
jgi:hypothetical protein